MPSSPQLGSIVQIAISVHDMDRAVAFYRDTLQLKFLFQAPNVAFFDCGNLRLMLGNAEPKDLKPAGTVVYFKVDDIDASFAQLEARGVDIAGRPHFVAKLGAMDLWMAFLRDPDGNMFALLCEKPAT